MYLHSFRIKDFRRLKDIHIELEKDISVFVGANNSGKTSATQAIQLFMACSKDKFSIHDFSAECWTTLNTIGELKEAGDKEVELTEILRKFPTITLDLWFSVSAPDLHRVIDILPNLDWTGSFVGMRLEFGPANIPSLLDRYLEAKVKAGENVPKEEGNKYHPWPKTLTEYLTQRLGQEFELRYYVLDRTAFDEKFKERAADYMPQQLTSEKGRGGAQIVKSILRVDCLDAQRHLSDSSGSRSEDLSRCLSRFYTRNLKKREEDHSVQRALSDARSQLNDHLEKVFGPTLNHLGTLGYPGLKNPKLLIRSALNPATVMSSQDGATVHYALESSGEKKEEYSLPDRYNGLGFKNLIYMVVELLDLHAQWLDTEEDRPPLHLVFIEEPEAHLHAQLQQVFIRKIFDILKLEEEDSKYYMSQLVVTTHSPHILYERGFQPIRYFRRSSIGVQTSDVLNLSAFYESDPTNRDFLQRYMKLTHCDLFFADAAILVEGNVERLLMPLMIAKEAEKLKSSYLSVLEIGGAYGHSFKSLIGFLGLVTLVVTDIDSVNPPPAPTGEPAEDDPDNQDEEGSSGTACPVQTLNAITSNQTLIQWLPKKHLISELLTATDAERTQEPTTESQSRVRVVYQTSHDVTWREETQSLVGRTFEEAFALENLVWTQHLDRRKLGLRIPKNNEKTLADLSGRIYKRVKSSGFNKTDFALSLLGEKIEDWITPRYIKEGLTWLTGYVAVEELIVTVGEEEVIETEVL